MKIGQIIDFLETKAPSSTSESWDNTGLLVGDREWTTRGVIVSIDLTEKALKIAQSRGYRLIVNHHPCIFPQGRGPSRLGADSLVFRAIQAGIAVASFHTNFDQCALEVPEAIASALGLELRGRLLEKPENSLLKLSVFVPTSHLEGVRSAVLGAGAGHIGNYDSCTFSISGEGTFRGRAGTNPAMGRPGVLARAGETRIETVIPRGLAPQVVRALRAAHPYEEVVYDLIPVLQRPGLEGVVRGLGYGFWGEWKRPKSFPELARDVKKVFNVNGFWVSQPSPARIRRLGFVAGQGADFIGAAKAAGCDVFLTGEVGYHAALGGSRQGMTVMELGHRESEKFFLSTVGDWLANEGLRTVKLDVPTQKFWLGGKT